MPRCCAHNLVLSPPSLLPPPWHPPFPLQKEEEDGAGGGAKATGVHIPRCGDTGDSEEPGPRCHRGVANEGPPTSHAILPGCGGGTGSSTQNWHRPPTPPPKWGAPAWGDAERGN